MTDSGPQEPQEIESFEDRIEILARELDLSIKWQRPCILLVVYSSEYVRADVMTAIQNYLIDLGQRTTCLSLKNEPATASGLLWDKFKEAPDSFFFVEGLGWAQNEALYSALNTQREFFIENRVRAIFWLTRNEIMDLAHQAPDFWAYRQRVIEFAESPKAEQVLQRALESAWQGIGEYAEPFEDTDAKILLRESLLTELPQNEEASSIRANLLLALGILNWRKGDFEKAHQQLREALKIAVKIQDNWFEAECFNAIALIKTSMERYNEAIDAYKQAIHLAPEQIFAWNNLGNLCARIDRNDEAIIAFLKAIEYNPKDPIAWNGLGNAYFKIGYVDDAVTAYRKSIQHMPTFAHPWSGLGDVYASTGRVDDALKAYQKAIELNRQYVTPWLRLAALFRKQDRHRDATKAYQKALALDPGNSHTWNDLGTIYLESEEYAEAADAFEKAIDLDRGHGWAYSNLALTFAQQGKYTDTIQLYLRSIELLKEDKDKAVSWNRLGNIYRLLNDYDHAIHAYRMADELGGTRRAAKVESTPAIAESAAAPESAAPAEVNQPQSAPVEAVAVPSPEVITAQNVSSQLPSLKSEPIEAPSWIFNPMPEKEPAALPRKPGQAERRVAQGPAFTVAVEETGEMNMKKSKAVQASPFGTDITEPAKADPADACVWNEKGNVHFKQGNYDEAIAAYNKALQLDPAFAWSYSNLALTYLTQGQYAEAILLYQKSIDLLNSDKEKAVSWNGLGNVYRCINDYPNAVAAYQKAAELDPETAGMRDGADTFQAGQNPKNAQVWNDLGDLFFKTGAYEEATQAFGKAIELDHESGWAYSNLARVLATQGKYSEAIPIYQKSIELLESDKDKAVTWNRLGNAYRKINDYDQAINAYQKAVTLADEGVDLVTRTRFSLLSNVYTD